MKKITILMLLFVSVLSYSQLKVSIKFKDNTEINDSIKQVGEKLISLKTGKTYTLNTINDIKIFEGNTVKHYFILDVKLYKNSKQVQKGIGLIIYSNGEITLYRILFGLKLKNKFNFPKTYNNRYEVFIKRKNKKYTYNIGCIDGTGCIKIKKRLKDFFNDCPNLVQMIKKNKINKREIIKIVDYYNDLCTK